MRIKVFGLFILLISNLAIANSTSTTTKITGLFTYAEAVNNFTNDVAVQVENPVAGCEAGFWLAASDVELNENMSAYLLAAFMAGTDVYFAAYTNQIWNGSSGNYCRIHSLGLSK